MKVRVIQSIEHPDYWAVQTKTWYGSWIWARYYTDCDEAIKCAKRMEKPEIAYESK